MLEELEKLKGTVTGEQLDLIKSVAGQDLLELFESALQASTEEEARDRTGTLSKALRESPVKAFKIYNRLNAEQKGLILGLMEDEEE